MITTLLELLEVSAWAGIAAVGFGILFNIPRKAIFTVFLLGFGAGFIKFILLHFDINIILASFIAASFVGILSLPLAHGIHQPPVVFSIPAVIPMIPGYFAYETVLSIMSFTFLDKNDSKRIVFMEDIFSNGFTMLFILISLTIGVSLPLLLLRKHTVKRTDN
ncbi:threonine/serine exporter family protein [Winogradskyella litoriviva]|uniref:Threonine/serine exporter family protein n=1 Tax=Winogradskyella litoriviva TaxID=1220182 RepID=A0ABX2E379_9FLAO|nr:threonine/serine exporter family protein [Winogradskyella litoriviva]NRD22211.1 threonine/serine exporter family protein [Winogradskyella litoriviva]